MAAETPPDIPDIASRTDRELLEEILLRLRQADALMGAWRIGGLRGLRSAVKGAGNGQG
jgi:hypothetical protein